MEKSWEEVSSFGRRAMEGGGPCFPQIHGESGGLQVS